MDQKILLCTDLDRTLLPNGNAPEHPKARCCFRKILQQDGIQLAYVSGRDRDLVNQAIDEFNLPQPDFVVADVGSTVYHIEDDNWNGDVSWQSKLSGEWNDNAALQIHQSLVKFTKLQLQEVNKQGVFKVSYYVSLPCDCAVVLADVEHCLKEQGITFNIIWSTDENNTVGMLDILPASASKRQAIEHIMLQHDYSYDQTLFAGDSGNDISVMISPVRSVLVANAVADIKQQAKQLATQHQQLENLYIARGKFLNGNYAAGIIEGLLYFYPHIKDWLGDCDNAE